MTASTSAQQVAVVGDLGQALMFSYRGNCYAVLPSHVKSRARISLASASPVLQGNGTIYFRTDKATDLAIALVEGPITKLCRLRWGNLPRDLSKILESGKDGYIKRIQENGRLERITVTIPDFGHYTITATLKNKTKLAFAAKGMSGSALYIGNVPIGIILKASNENQVTAYRMDEVVLRLKRWIEGRAENTTQTSKIIATRQAISRAGNSFPYRVSFWNTASIRPELNAQNLEKDTNTQPYIAPWTGLPVLLTMEFFKESAQTIRSITIISKIDDERFTIPKSIRIRVDSSQGENRFWRPLYSSEMSPSGYLKIPTGGTSARRIEITVDKVWNPKKAVRIDRIFVE